MKIQIPDLPPSQLVPWAKQQIEHLTKLVSFFEGFVPDAPKASNAIKLLEPSNAQIFSPNDLSLDSLSKAITEQGGRVKHFAQRFGVTEEAIEAVIRASNNKIFKADRGWLKVAAADKELNF